nr:GNAT family N-acetyltransferase [Mesobacterium pallidum]
MIAAFHVEMGIERSDAQRAEVLGPLLDGIPHGVAYLIGPRRSPVGYIVITFGYAIELGGIEAFIDEFWIRPAVRGRGMGSEVLADLGPALGQHGVKALHLEVKREDAAAQKLYTRNHFRLRDGYCLMTRKL